MLLTVDRKSGEPVWKQICESIARLVDEGSLEPGTRLPPSRILADTAGVNRSTVYRAYQELWALGYVESRPGSYTTVRGRMRTTAGKETAAGKLINWERVSAPATRAAYRNWLHQLQVLPQNAEALDFASLAADRELCPLDGLRRSIKKALVREKGRVLDYGDPAGYAHLRETVARRMRTHGVTVTADQVMIVGGAQHALDLVLRLLAPPGTGIVVESPTYASAIPLFRMHQLKILEMPMRSEGADLEVLETRLRNNHPALVYTMPNFQNPTGITTSQAHRERLLSLCEAYRVPILEDGFEEEMKYFGKMVLPIKSMDRNGIVMYAGTFSKIVFSGLRVGWVAADAECIRRLAAINRHSSLSGNTLVQAAMDNFCVSGDYESHLRRLHRVYRKRMQVMLKSLRQHVPESTAEWTQPVGGYTLWLRVRKELPEREQDLCDRLYRSGVLVVPGSLFFPGKPRAIFLRLSIAKIRENDLDEGCRRLGKVLSDFVSG